MEKRKAQSAVEVMLISGMLVAVLVFLQVQLAYRNSQINEALKEREADRLCLLLSSQVAGAQKSGYLGYFWLAFDENVYDVAVYEGFAVANYSGGSCQSANALIRPGSIKYVNQAPPFNLTSGYYNISNSEGVVTIAKIS